MRYDLFGKTSGKDFGANNEERGVLNPAKITDIDKAAGAKKGSGPEESIQN